jgi:hypothetical protein
MEGYIGFENYKDNKLRLEVGHVYTRRPVIGGKLVNTFYRLKNGEFVECKGM